MKIKPIILSLLFLVVFSANLAYAEGWRDRESEEKIAMIYGVSIVLAGLAIAGGIYLSRRKPNKQTGDIGVCSNPNTPKKPENALDELIFTLYGNPPPPKTANLVQAIELAHTELLMGVVSRDNITQIATELNNGPIPYTTNDLALSVGLNFFKRADMVPQLNEAQIHARLKMLEWVEAKTINPILAKNFEDMLYKLYKPA